MRPRLLFVAHEVTLTGSPMNLLHFVRWLSEHVDADLEVLALRDGALRHEFEQVCKVRVLDKGPVAGTLASVQAGLQHLGSRRAWKPVAMARYAPQLRAIGHYDLVYLNSLPSITVLPYLPSVGHVVSHVHELQVAFRVWNAAHDIELFRTKPERWLAASNAVRDFLVDEVELPADRVLVHYEYIQAAKVAAREVGLRDTMRLRRELRIPVEAAVVAGAGTVDWRKGADLFVQLACEVRRRTREPVHFVWVGGDLRSPDWERVRSDRDRAGADHVHFIGVKPDPMPWFALADVFALTSREDPFPLVALECAAMGKPLVTYRNGGIPELLEAAGPAAAAGVVDHLAVSDLADRVIALIDDDQLRRQAGGEVRDHVLAHHDVSVAAPRLWADLERLLAGT